MDWPTAFLILGVIVVIGVLVVGGKERLAFATAGIFCDSYKSQAKTRGASGVAPSPDELAQLVFGLVGAGSSQAARR
jgi:hypothetical protein